MYDFNHVITLILIQYSSQGRRNEGRAKGGSADGKGNFGLMNNSFNAVDINPQVNSMQHYLSVR